MDILRCPQSELAFISIGFNSLLFNNEGAPVCSDRKILLVLQLMEIAVKNMVCDRCVSVVTGIMRSLGYPEAVVTMGRVALDRDLSGEELDRIDRCLVAEGFQLLRDRGASLVEKVKAAVLRLARSRDDDRKVKLSVYLSDELGVDYRTLGRLFAEHENRTIERYYIAQKIEYVKELLDYGEMTVSEIACLTGYSSVAHLSRQFREETGMTPTAYRETGKRIPLDKV